MDFKNYFSKIDHQCWLPFNEVETNLAGLWRRIEAVLLSALYEDGSFYVDTESGKYVHIY